MTQPRPTAAELVDAVRAFLEEDVMPALDGRLQFHTRVAVNVLATVGRELTAGPAADTAEAGRLTALLGHDGAADELAAELARAIRTGEVDIADPDLLAHLRATAAADVAIANPRHAEPSGG